MVTTRSTAVGKAPTAALVVRLFARGRDRQLAHQRIQLGASATVDEGGCCRGDAREVLRAARGLGRGAQDQRGAFAHRSQAGSESGRQVLRLPTVSGGLRAAGADDYGGGDDDGA